MKNCYLLFVGLFCLTNVSVFAQRQELSVSPIGFFYPKNQLIQYERYVDTKQSLTASLGVNGDQRATYLFVPIRTDSYWNARAAVGYRYYFPGLGLDQDLTIFGSVRAVVDYSSLQIKPGYQISIPQDSLRASGISLAPEILFGGKITIANRITLSIAAGGQYLIKLLPTGQITNNPAYWRKVNSEDNDNWQANRNTVVNYRKGWSPSMLLTMGIVFGKRT